MQTIYGRHERATRQRPATGHVVPRRPGRGVPHSHLPTSSHGGASPYFAATGHSLNVYNTMAPFGHPCVFHHEEPGALSSPGRKGHVVGRSMTSDSYLVLTSNNQVFRTRTVTLIGPEHRPAPCQHGIPQPRRTPPDVQLLQDRSPAQQQDIEPPSRMPPESLANRFDTLHVGFHLPAGPLPGQSTTNGRPESEIREREERLHSQVVPFDPQPPTGLPKPAAPPTEATAPAAAVPVRGGTNPSVEVEPPAPTKGRRRSATLVQDLRDMDPSGAKLWSTADINGVIDALRRDKVNWYDQERSKRKPAARF